MNKKEFINNCRAQGLPMNTIIIIILVLFVLAGVGIFFFTQFAAGGEGASQAQCIQLCESIKSNIAAKEEGKWSDVQNTQIAQRFCEGNNKANNLLSTGCTAKVNCEVIYEYDAQGIPKTGTIGTDDAACPT